MICYVFKVRQNTFTSKRDNKLKTGLNIGLLALEGAKFHLESFVEFSQKDVFVNIAGGSKSFTTGFYDIDIDEFETRNEYGISIYQKKIIQVKKKIDFDKVKELF